ncbi:DEAD/DEAH box helicase family protein [Pseudomonas asuensis]
MHFLARIPAGGYILDAGCGSGRDAKAFIQQGYQVSAFDASPALADLASDYLGQPVQVLRFSQFSEVYIYDGIWACASLLHVPQIEMPQALANLWRGLKPGGAFYCSFKLGRGEREQSGRRFTDADEEQLREWLATVDDVADIKIWHTRDQRPGRDEQWINLLACRAEAPRQRLVTGGQDHFLPHLLAAISSAKKIDMAVAFVMTGGLDLLIDDLHVKLQPPGEHEAAFMPARVRILTSDYFDVTDVEALRRLMLLQDAGAEVRVYECKGPHSFHLKAYLFVTQDDSNNVQGQAFIGSSNISRKALRDGLEWNYRIDYPGDKGFLEACDRFETLFADPRSKPLTHAWIDAYEARRKKLPTLAPIGVEEEIKPPPTPTSIQNEALAALDKTRVEGYQRGLVVLATGLGKTWLAAFDARQFGAKRVLFVAHREEILHQAAETFVRIRPGLRVGYYMNQQRDIEVEVLCASIQTLGRNEHLQRFLRAISITS